MTRLAALASGCIGVERENIGAADDGTGGLTAGGTFGDGDGEGDDGAGTGDGDGDTGNGTSSGDGDGDGDGDAGDGDGDGEAAVPRLFVIDEGLVDVFDSPAEVVAGEAPDLTLDPPGVGERVAVEADRLFVAWGTDAFGVQVWEGADALVEPGPGDLALDGVTGGSATDLHVGAGGQLWRSGDNVEWWADVASIGSAFASASFATQVPADVVAVDFDPISNRLFGASTAGLWTWDQPLDAAGVDVSPDSELIGELTFGDVQVWDTDLVAVETGVAVHLWSDLPGLTPPAAPDISLAGAAGLSGPVGAVLRDGALAVTDQADGGGAVHIWFDVGTITDSTPADVVLVDDAIVSPSQVVMGMDGTLYVLDEAAVVVIVAPSSDEPSIETLDVVAPEHMALMECSPAQPCGGGGACAGGLCR